jgi:hypothetical protein
MAVHVSALSFIIQTERSRRIARQIGKMLTEQKMVDNVGHMA